MTAKESNLLAVFDERMHDLIKLCNAKDAQIAKLEVSLTSMEDKLRQATQTIEALQTKYASLLVARQFAENEGELQNARKRVDRLVREVKTCIDLLKD